MTKINNLIDEFRNIPNHKLLARLFSLIAFLSFGYALINPTIGMDDTDIAAYFEAGLAPQVGRWTIFVLNKFFHMAEFTPFLLDAIGVILLILASLSFVLLINRITKASVGTLGLMAFGCVFLSSPFMGEVFIYYLHNGIGLSFLLVALTGICMHKAINRRKKMYLLPACLFLSLAIGCYESFALVYILMVCFIFFLEEVFKENIKASQPEYTNKFLVKVVAYIIPLLGAMLVRKIAYTIITMVLGIEKNARSLSVMSGWASDSPLAIIKDLLFKFILRYIVEGRFFFGVRVYTIILALFLLGLVFMAIRQKNVKIPLYGLGMILIPWLLIPIELVITPYRASQALVLFIAMAAMILFNLGQELSLKTGKFKETLTYIWTFILLIIVFNQAFALNRYFYMDNLKYENDQRVCLEIGQTLREEYDLSKPVAFVGEYMMPEAIREYSYVAPDSPEFEKLENTLNFSRRMGFYEYVDNKYGYKIYEIGSQDPLAWMRWAVLDEQNGLQEIYKYMRSLGFSLVQPTGEQAESAKEKAMDTPAYPQKGYITQTNDLIIVKLGPIIN